MLFCVGDEACTYATITSTRAVYCSGYKSCSTKCTITAPTIYCTAEDSCRGATLYGDGNLDIYALGSDAVVDTTVICNSGDICSIYCADTLARCDLMIESGGGDFIYIYSLPSQSPTNNPTTFPTRYPTIPPTAQPSVAPTAPSSPPARTKLSSSLQRIISMTSFWWGAHSGRG